MELKFFLLGPSYATWNNSVLNIPRLQVRTLLFYLATYPNAIPQERLHYLFWNDKSETQCRRNLSHLLTHVRKVLPDDKILIVLNSLLMLDHEKIWCDVVEFKKLLRTSKGDDQYQAFQQANELYRGPFLEGLQLPGGREFEYLIEHERFYLERNYLNLVYKLIVLEKGLGNLEAAIEHAYQYLAIDDLSEEVHRQLITLYGLSGKRERALVQYKTCEDILMRELQTKPSKKTQAIYQKVLSGKLTEDENIAVRGVVAEIRPVRDDPTFISKERLNQLNNVINQGDKYLSGIALISGELGIGKSSLLSKYLEGYENDILVLRTKCNPGSRSLKYWPVRQICSAASKVEHPSLANKIDALDDIKRCMLRLTDNYFLPEEANSSNGLKKEAHFSLFTQIIFKLAEAAGGLILCFEELEWADEDTLDLILYLCSYLRENKLLIIGSYCCEGNEYLKKFLQNVHLTDDFLGDMRIGGIDLDTSRIIVKYWLGEFEGLQLLSEKLHRASGGNPFFLSEILRWMFEAEISVAELLQSENIPLPTSVSKAVGFRLSRLSALELKILEIAAIIGYSFSLDQIIELAEFSPMQVIDALDGMVVRHLLESHSSNYQFRHELIYQSVLERMSPARKQILERNLSGTRSS